MKSTLIFIGICLILGCKTKQNTQANTIENNFEVNETEISNDKYPAINIRASLGDVNTESSHVQILKSKIEGNSLILKIGYSGGCAEHTFEFIGSEMIAKSLPPIRTVTLVHNSNGESCRAYIERELIIDISELAYKKESGSEIKLKAKNTEEFILYSYQG